MSYIGVDIMRDQHFYCSLVRERKKKEKQNTFQEKVWFSQVLVEFSLSLTTQMVSRCFTQTQSWILKQHWQGKGTITNASHSRGVFLFIQYTKPKVQ